jgi:nicotinamidase-related amidase
VKSALIVVDMLNEYDHEDAEVLVESVRAALPAMRGLVERARREQTPVVYVNDNYGDWSAGRPEILERALAGRARDVVEPIVPADGTWFIAKARHSIFYETQLEYLLREQEIERVVLVGQVTEQCILYSALDAYVRHFTVAVPCDAVAGIHDDLADAALRMMERNMRADVAPAQDCALS